MRSLLVAVVAVSCVLGCESEPKSSPTTKLSSAAKSKSSPEKDRVGWVRCGDYYGPGHKFQVGQIVYHVADQRRGVELNKFWTYDQPPPFRWKLRNYRLNGYDVRFGALVVTPRTHLLDPDESDVREPYATMHVQEYELTEVKETRNDIR